MRQTGHVTTNYSVTTYLATYNGAGRQREERNENDDAPRHRIAPHLRHGLGIRHKRCDRTGNPVKSARNAHVRRVRYIALHAKNRDGRQAREQWHRYQ